MPLTCITTTTVTLMAARGITGIGCSSLAGRDEGSAVRGPAYIATTRWVNSMSGLSAHWGAISSGRQPGQVGQEAPDPVAHTTAPIATAKNVNSAARRNTVSAVVDGAEVFLDREESPGNRRRAVGARSTPYASGNAAARPSRPTPWARTFNVHLMASSGSAAHSQRRAPGAGQASSRERLGSSMCTY